MKKYFIKKPKRPRQVPPLNEREKERELTRPKIPDNVIPIDPNAPQRLESRTKIFIVYAERLRNFPWKKLTVTFLVILFGGIGSAWFQARNSNIEQEITVARRNLTSIEATNVTLDSQLQSRYTHIEIERIASERLGMAAPDISQIISIYVPRLGGVTLNTAEDVLPQHNYFWNDVSDFFAEFFNRIFGG
jgi:cell division protein FtsL